jgi:hypothetical protein
MADINKENLQQLEQMGKHQRIKNKKYRPIFPSSDEAGSQINTSDRNIDTLMTDRSDKGGKK